ncbi:MAG: PE-PGRS family protein, partial [Myxococcota bacterium]|nr:PE-PGRS family protein [Myxococcota bacterium]
MRWCSSVLAVLAVVGGRGPALPAAHAGTIAVSTAGELIAAIDAAQPGDVIVLADGTYALTGASCDVAGTAAQPIVVRAATPLGARIELDSLEGFRVTAAHWHFEGLDIRGTCAVDASCEHAFHVSGAADGFVLRHSRVMDFNAQLKVNASKIGDVHVAPDRGLVEYNELGDSRPRDTSNPVTKLNIDTGDDWVVRGNYLHDARKLQGDGVSYAAFLKSGGKRGLVERNLVVCATAGAPGATGGTRIGLSFGGGGTGNEFCAPAFDPAVPCSVEHDGGTIRNNIIASCSDVGIYLNRAPGSTILHNTLIGTAGIDFRFATTSGEATGNVLTGMVRTRDGATMTATANQQGVTLAMFEAMYRAPLAGDLVVTGDVSGLLGGAPGRADVPDDYCGVTRPAGRIALGAIEHALPGCETLRPPQGTVGG